MSYISIMGKKNFVVLGSILREYYFIRDTYSLSIYSKKVECERKRRQRFLNFCSSG